MFSKTRQKIVLTTVLALVLLLAGTLGIIYVSNWFSINRQNSEMLERYISVYSLDSLPGEGVPAPPPEGGAVGAPEDGAGGAPGLPPAGDPSEEAGSSGAIYQLSSFYSTAFSTDEEVLAVDTGWNRIYTKEEIVDTARAILTEGRSSGYRAHLLYRVEQREDYTLVAFMDMTLSDNNMWSLFVHTFFAGAVAIAVMAVISWQLARYIIKPLEENDLRQKQFISDAGHELKTPIAVISANAEILERQSGTSEWLENIQYENKRMGELVTGLLDLSRAENASVPMEILDLSRLAEREVLPFESVAFEQGIMIESEIAPDVRVNGNPAQLRQLVSILVDNAIDHGKDGKTVRVTLASDRKHAVLTVANKGEIPQGEMDKLFDRFYRTDEARSEAGRHYGLGLSIAKAIAESHGGKISASSESGEVRFAVTLPLSK